MCVARPGGKSQNVQVCVREIIEWILSDAQGLFTRAVWPASRIQTISRLSSHNVITGIVTLPERSSSGYKNCPDNKMILLIPSLAKSIFAYLRNDANEGVQIEKEKKNFLTIRAPSSSSSFTHDRESIEGH